MEEMMKIAEFSKEFVVKKSTIRFYTDINLLIPNKKNGYFDYNEQCREDMESIMSLKSFGFSIKEIQLLKAYERFRQVYTSEDLEYLFSIIDNKISSLKNQLTNINVQIEGLKQYKKVKSEKVCTFPRVFN
jgi:DNA-binding transcriptional MerR regulator